MSGNRKPDGTDDIVKDDKGERRTYPRTKEKRPIRQIRGS